MHHDFYGKKNLQYGVQSFHTNEVVGNRIEMTFGFQDGNFDKNFGEKVLFLDVQYFEKPRLNSQQNARDSVFSNHSFQDSQATRRYI